MEKNKVVDKLTEREMEVVMTVFKSYETGLREATIYPKVKFIKTVVDAENKVLVKCQSRARVSAENVSIGTQPTLKKDFYQFLLKFYFAKMIDIFFSSLVYIV